MNARRSNRSWLTLSLLAVGAGGPAFASERLLRELPGVVRVSLAHGDTSVGGVPVRFAQVVSTESPQALQRHFAERFVQWGLYVAPLERQRGLRGGFAVTGLDVRTHTSYSVLMRPRRHGTELLVAEADLAALATPARVDPGVPILAGAAPPVVVQSEGARLVTYQVRATAAEIAAFYAETLPAAGFRSAGAGRYERADAAVSVTTSPQRDAATAVVVEVTGR